MKRFVLCMLAGALYAGDPVYAPPLGDAAYTATYKPGGFSWGLGAFFLVVAGTAVGVAMAAGSS